MLNNAGIAIDRSECTFVEQWSDTTAVIGCVGVIDMLTVSDLERHIGSALEKRPKSLIVDLTGVIFLASCGMNALIATHHQCFVDTEFLVVADGPVTRRPMQLIGVTDILKVSATVNDALRSATK